MAPASRNSCSKRFSSPYARIERDPGVNQRAGRLERKLWGITVHLLVRLFRDATHVRLADDAPLAYRGRDTADCRFRRWLRRHRAFGAR